MAEDEQNGRLTTYELVRGYVILGMGVFLIIYSLVAPIKPAILTLGGSLIGTDPLLRAAR